MVISQGSVDDANFSDRRKRLQVGLGPYRPPPSRQGGIADTIAGHSFFAIAAHY
jgi:hypothetical protein